MGTLIENNGTKYEGEWFDEMFHGQGKLIENDKVYEGKFLNNKREGFLKSLDNEIMVRAIKN